MQYRSRGATLGAFLVGTVACGVLVWGALFFFNDIFRARVFSMVHDLRRWTPDGIEQDPLGYLVSVGERTEELLDRLLEKETVLVPQNYEFVVLRANASANVQVVSVPLEQLKVVFREAESSGEWPVLWEGILRDRDWAQDQIVILHRQLKDQREQVDRVDLEANPFELQLAKVRVARQQCELQLARIDVLNETVERDSVPPKLVQQLSDMEGLLHDAHAMLLALESEELPELIPTRTLPEEPVDQLVFESILND